MDEISKKDNIEGNEVMKPIIVDKVDLEILYILLADRCNTPISSMTIQNITDSIEENKKSYHTYSKRIKEKLIPLKYIKEGMMDSRSRTYYITELGVQLLKSNDMIVEDNK